MKCFYHDDLDGRCAAFWVRLNVGLHPEPDGAERGGMVGVDLSGPDKGKVTHYQDAEFIPVDYKDPFPLDRVRRGEQVWIVDFALEKPDEMRRLLEITDDVTWIDHHITHIKQYEGFDIPVRGIRRDGIAACVLTFIYIHHMTARGDGEIKPFDEAMLTKPPAVPMFTRYIGDRDTWTWKYGDATRNFYAGFMLEDTRPESEAWTEVAVSARDTKKWQEIGRKAEAAKRRADAEFLDAFGFYCEWEGYRILACNKGRTSSDLFGSAEQDSYDIMAPFVFDGKRWTVSLYSTSVDVSELAVKHGGGGHKRAAGFTCDTLPFSAPGT